MTISKKHTILENVRLPVWLRAPKRTVLHFVSTLSAIGMTALEGGILRCVHADAAVHLSLQFGDAIACNCKTKVQGLTVSIRTESD